jgi:putative restriction endonuclease
MQAWVGITDGDWYRFLARRPDLDEVNFWQPGGSREFRRLSVGQPFLFKLHAPDNFIAGGGFFRHNTLLPATAAWDAFGDKNGTATFDEMRRRIERYRRVPPDPRADYTIGCILLQAPFFFDREDWIPAPHDFHPNIVQGKTYDLTTGVGKDLWDSVLARLRTGRATEDFSELAHPPMFREGVSRRERLGQGTFRVLITDTYQRRCAVTREKALPVLQAAHIRPVTYGGAHRIDNGLLLRSDIHTLFDRGYVTITPRHKFLVSRRLRDDFHNGEHYFRLAETDVWMPADPADRPNRQFLEWHADAVFKR